MKKNLNGKNQKPGFGEPGAEAVTIHHRAVLATSAPAAPPVSLSNECGFWELSFLGHSAVLKQHPGLFFVACLIAQPLGQPVTAPELASTVYDLFHNHPDFMRELAWLCRQQSEASVLKIFRKKEKALEAILDSVDELEPTKTEAQEELLAIYEFQKSYFQHCPEPTVTAERISKVFLSLYSTLAAAVDPLGKPQPTIRAFAFHILLNVLMPSIRLSALTGELHFIYQHSQS